MTLRGSTGDFPLDSVVGLLASTNKTGELIVRGDGKLGALGFASGRLVAAVIENEGGENALGAIFAIARAEFEFAPWATEPESNLEPGDIASMLERAAGSRDRLHANREVIPDDRIRFKLSTRAAEHGSVTLSPERWRAVLLVDGERDVIGLAEQLRIGRMEALALLADLVREDVIETLSRPMTPEAMPIPPMPQPPAAAAPGRSAIASDAPGRSAVTSDWPSPRPATPLPSDPWSSPAAPSRPNAPAAPATEGGDQWGPAQASWDAPHASSPAASAPSAENAPSPPAWGQAPAVPASDATKTPAPQSSISPPGTVRGPAAGPRQTEVRADLATEIARRFGDFTPAPDPAAPVFEPAPPLPKAPSPVAPEPPSPPVFESPHEVPAPYAEPPAQHAPYAPPTTNETPPAWGPPLYEPPPAQHAPYTQSPAPFEAPRPAEPASVFDAPGSIEAPLAGDAPSTSYAPPQRVDAPASPFEAADAPAPTTPQQPAPASGSWWDRPGLYTSPSVAKPEQAPNAEEMTESAAPMNAVETESPAPPVVAPADERLEALRGTFPPVPAGLPTETPPPPMPRSEPEPEPPTQSAASDVMGAAWKTPGKAASQLAAEAPLAPAPPPPPLAAPVAPPSPAPAPPAERKGGGFFGRFMKEAPAPAPAAAAPSIPPKLVVSRTGALALLSNALLVEYNSGHWGKGRIESRMANLLMRVDEQADPIDRPLPIVDDQIDATALEREQLPEQQTLPYLATLVRQIFEDAERVFGKDKAKKGYKAARQQLFGGDAHVLNDADLASKLPKV